MSTNSLIDISPQNIKGDCDLKCSYSLNYAKTNLTIKNNDTMLTLTPDATTSSEVTYNDYKYNVSQINIYVPSLHLFNGRKVAGEIQIEHIPQTGGNNLYVCIPLVGGGDETDASRLISKVIMYSSQRAPSKNESANLNTGDFTLKTMVPVKPFYSYTGGSNLPGEFIVYGMNNGIPINTKLVGILTKIIKPYGLEMTGGSLFYNPKGPRSGEVGDGIYISCQPTGSSSDTTTVENDKANDSQYNLGDIFKSDEFKIVVQVILASMIFIVLIYGLNVGFTYLMTGEKPNMDFGNFNVPSLNMPSLSVPKFNMPSFGMKKTDAT